MRGDRVLGRPKVSLASRVLEDRVEDLAVDVHRAGAEVLLVDRGEEPADVLGRDAAELPTAEGPHDPGALLRAVAVARLGEEDPVAGERRGLGPSLGPQVVEPGCRGLLEERLAALRASGCSSASTSAITRAISR